MSKAKNPSVVDGARRLGDGVLSFGRDAYHFSLGAVATAEEEVRDMFGRLVSKGEAVDKSGATIVSKATGEAKRWGQEVEDRFQSTVSATLHRAGVPSRDEIGMLIQRVEELTEKVESLRARPR